MTDVIANLFRDVHLPKPKLTVFVGHNCFLIAFTASVYSLLQMMLSVLADGITNWLWNAMYERCSSWFDIVFYRIGAKTYPNMR